MPRLVMRFDLRNLDQAANPRLYREALEMAAWGEANGFDAVQLAEHHGCDDGYVPTPAVFAGALAARTSKVRLRLVLVLPLYDPIRLAEELAVLDVLSDGRVTPILAAGYAAREFEMFGVRLSDRGRLMTEGVDVLRKAWTGEPFDYRGRRARVTPRPVQQPMPIWMGGSSRAAAMRAGELAERFYSNDSALWEAFRARALELGIDRGPAPDIGPGFLVVSDDPDGEWARMGRYIAAEVETYAKLGASARMLMGDGAAETSRPVQPDLAQLRASNGYPILTPGEAAAYVRRLGPDDEIGINPLISGLPAEIAWEHLESFARHVVPLAKA
jgi:alkanesulfonate monooxygenase SsuD/methylene tetrahydromethanopterin reductase-like flavin-dependent oxidoreductase (luciferase family)